ARTLTVEVRNPRTVGAVTNMLPAEGAVNTYLPVNLTWTAAANADAYDVYIWPDSVAARPASAIATGITGPAYSVKSGLSYDVTYKWQVVAKNNCRFTESPVQK